MGIARRGHGDDAQGSPKISAATACPPASSPSPAAGDDIEAEEDSKAPKVSQAWLKQPLQEQQVANAAHHGPSIHAIIPAIRAGPGGPGDGNGSSSDDSSSDVGIIAESNNTVHLDRRVRRKIDLRLCTIAGLLCAMDLIDGGILSSASATTMPATLGLTGDRYSMSIWLFTLAQLIFKLPATIAMRLLGAPLFFTLSTTAFGLLTLCMAYVTTWRQMIALRFLMGMAMAGIYPGLTYLLSVWYTRREMQLRFAYLQSGQVVVVATGSIVNFGLTRLDGQHGLRDWQWMFVVQGAITMLIGLVTYVWIPDFPENAGRTARFLSPTEAAHVLHRIQKDRQDAGAPEPLTARAVLEPFLDPKLHAFGVLFFLQNVVSTALSYFIPTILLGMGFRSADSILLYAPPYYYAVLPALASALVSDRLAARGPVVAVNAACLIAGMAMLGFARESVAARYVGVMLATGAYVANWAGLNAYQANNVTGQWKRATMAASVSAMNALGGIAGSYIFRESEAPWYPTAVWISIGSHILIIAIITVCSVWFVRANRKARAGTAVIEGTVGFLYTI